MKRENWLVIALFFLSGAAGLIYQTVWQRQLVTLYGSTVFATAAVLGSFMTGLAVGSALAGQWVRNREEVSFAFYGYLELAIAGSGLLSLAFLGVHRYTVTHLLGFISMGYRAYVAKGIVILPFLLIPTMAMGATFPVFLRAWNRSMVYAGARVSIAYGSNTLGAFMGTLLSAFFLIPGIGLKRTLLTAAILNILVGLSVLAILRKIPEKHGGIDKSPSRVTGLYPTLGRWPVILYACIGFASITLEIAWTRILVLHFGSSVYAFALMLAVVLLGIALGSLLIGRWADRFGMSAFAAVFAAISLSLFIQMHQFLNLGSIIHTLAMRFGLLDFGSLYTLLGLSAFQVLALPTLGMGLAFPLGIRLFSRTVKEIAVHSGYLYSANTTGAIGAALLAPVLLGSMGMNATLSLVAGMYLLVALLVILFCDTSRNKKIITTSVFLIIGILGFQYRVREPVLLAAGIFHTEASRVIDYQEGLTGFVDTTRVHSGWMQYKVLEINGINVAGTSPDLQVIQKLQGHLPLFLHPNPRSVLHIGFGSGGTAYAVSLHPVKSIDVVEISPDVVAMAQKHFQEVNHRVWDDPRVHFFWGDGRNYLLGMTKTYDVILSDSIHPRYAGNGGLYTLEYFRLAASRLNKDGVFSMWLPLYSLSLDNFKEILKAFYEVFPRMYLWYVHNTINNYVLVTGLGETMNLIPLERVSRRFFRESVLRDLSEIRYHQPLDILDNLVIGPEKFHNLLASVEPHRDDRPRVEFESARVLDRDASWILNFDWVVNAREPLEKYLAPVSDSSESWIKRYSLARDKNLLGQWYFLHCRPIQATQSFNEALVVLPDHKEPWEYVRFHILDRLQTEFCRKEYSKENP